MTPPTEAGKQCPGVSTVTKLRRNNFLLSGENRSPSDGLLCYDER